MNGSKTDRQAEKLLGFFNKYGSSSANLSKTINTPPNVSVSYSDREGVNYYGLRIEHITDSYKTRFNQLSTGQKLRMQEVYSKHPYIVKEFAATRLLGIPLTIEKLDEYMGDSGDQRFTQLMRITRTLRLAKEVLQYGQK